MTTNVKESQEELDLIELIFWENKIWIIISAIIFTTVAGIYAFTAKKQWTSKAEIIGSQLNDLANYLGIRKEYSRILGENLDKAFNTAINAGIKEYSNNFIENANSALEQKITLSDAKIPLSDSKLSNINYLFMLVETYLKAQIAILKNKEIIFPSKYYQIQEQLNELEPLFEKTKTIKIKLYSYHSFPDNPVIKDKQKMLILLIGAFFGLTLGTRGILPNKIQKKEF